MIACSKLERITTSDWGIQQEKRNRDQLKKYVFPPFFECKCRQQHNVSHEGLLLNLYFQTLNSSFIKPVCEILNYM